MKLNKKVLELNHQLTNTKIVFCYGQKSYKKYINKEFGIKDRIVSDAITTIISHSATGDLVIVVGVKKHINIYSLKALIVHELSHVVTELMKEFKFDCDEFRSYTIQWLYLEIIYFVDNLIKE